MKVFFVLALLFVAVSAQTCPVPAAAGPLHAYRAVNLDGGTIAVDYFPQSSSFVVSGGYPDGYGTTFKYYYTDPAGVSSMKELLKYDGSCIGCGSDPNDPHYKDEVKFHVIRNDLGGFQTGDIYAYNGLDAIPGIAKITSTSYDRQFESGDQIVGKIRGGIHHDTTGVFGNDIVFCTIEGRVYRMDSTGHVTLLAAVTVGDVDPNRPGDSTIVHLEGITTVDENPAKWGPLAGKIIVGCETHKALVAIGADGSVASYQLPFAVEDIDRINAGETFVGVDYGASRLLMIHSSNWANYAGGILLTQEHDEGNLATFPLRLGLLKWSADCGVHIQPLAKSRFSLTPQQWEHVSFIPTDLDIPPPGSEFACCDYANGGYKEGPVTAYAEEGETSVTMRFSTDLEPLDCLQVPAGDANEYHANYNPYL